MDFETVEFDAPGRALPPPSAAEGEQARHAPGPATTCPRRRLHLGRRAIPLVFFTALLALGCPATSAPTGVRAPGATEGAPLPGASSASAPGTATPLDSGTTEESSANEPVWAYLDGAYRRMDIETARSFGFTIVDLSDDWVPFIFWSQTPGKDDLKPNQYASNYVDLANDRIDVNGDPLAEWDRNYLEVYGIPPTLAVLRRRLVEAEQKSCFRELDLEVFREYHGPVDALGRAGLTRLQRQYTAARAAFRKALRAARARSLEELLQHDKYAGVAREYQRLHWRVKANEEMRKRIACEGMHGNARASRVADWDVRRALKRFERKHNIYGWGMINQDTASALGRTPQENVYESLKRIVTERVVDATGILEDGSRTDAYRGADGSTRGVRNLVEEFQNEAIQALGIHNAESAKAFIERHTEEAQKQLFVALRLPATPEYYADHMELDVVIHRGDVWYDLPFNEKGKALPQPRNRLPTFTLFATYEGQRIGLVSWRTTIGGWKEEKRGAEEFYKYKVSDVGPRIWRHVVAGPVWVPPKNTPTTDLVKYGVGGRIVGSSTFGPGFASAYGLVAGFHVREGDGFDNQIRTHGTVNYMSVMRGFSHGCHRLFNYRAVRLFSFALRHRTFSRKGQSRLSYEHRFEHAGEEFQINLHTRGYYYELTPPIPVNVLEGRVRGKLKEPIEDYVKKPGQLYQEDLPEHPGRRKTTTGAPRTGTQETNPLIKHQTL